MVREAMRYTGGEGFMGTVFLEINFYCEPKAILRKLIEIIKI